MNYIYDIVLNFNKEYYSFYEWNRKDNIINVKKIPLFLVDNECFNIIKYDNVCVSKDFINVIRDKTYTYTRSKLGPSLLISNNKEVIAIMFNENGNLISENFGRIQELSDEFSEETVKDNILYVTKEEYEYLKKIDNETGNRMNFDEIKIKE